MGRKAGSAVVALALVSLFFAPPAGAQAEYETPRKLQQIQGERFAKLWNRELEKAEALLRAGESEKAYKKASGVSRRITDEVIAGAGIGVFFGRAMALQAVAAVDVGRPDEGLWRWQLATQFFPDLLELDLAGYGEPGRFLAESPVRRLGQGGSPRSEGDLQPAKWTHTSEPRWPRAKLNTPTVRIVLELVMGADGSLREPVIVDAAGELTMVFATLEEMRGWKFEPATLDGEPVDSLLRQTFTFRVRG